jgi:hypothetical protein
VRETEQKHHKKSAAATIHHGLDEKNTGEDQHDSLAFNAYQSDDMAFNAYQSVENN